MSAVPPACLILRREDRAAFLGRRGTGRGVGMVWAVFHAGLGGWTHLYFIADRDPRSVHLLEVRLGDALDSLRREAVEETVCEPVFRLAA